MKKMIMFLATILICGTAYAQERAVRDPRDVPSLLGEYDGSTKRIKATSDGKLMVETGAVAGSQAVYLSSPIPAGTNLIGNVNAWQAGTWNIGNLPNDYYKGGNITVSVSSGSINAAVSGSLAVTNFPATQTTADARYQAKVSSGTAGKITGVTSSSITVSDNVSKFTFKYRNDADASQYMSVSNSIMGGASYLADGDVVSVEVITPAPVTFTISDLSASATLQYIITTLK